MNKKTLFIILCLISAVLLVAVFISLSNNSKNAEPADIQNEINGDQALKIIADRAEIIAYEVEMAKAGKKANFEIQDEGEEWLIQVFEIVQNDNELPHTATFNWYRVNKKTSVINAEF